MNEWGIPDWTDPASYGETGDWHLWRWRWEFYRRRDDLRLDYVNFAEDHYLDLLKLAEVLEDPTYNEETISKPGTRNFSVTAPGCSGKYGYPSIPNPAFGDHCIRDIWPIYDLDEDVSFCYSPNEDDQVVPIGMDTKNFAILFNLEKRLGPQLLAAKEELSRHQHCKLGQLVQKRRQPEKWLEYLRALDGAEDGASLSQIAEILQHKAQTQQGARDTLKAARRLRTNF